jgi:hypothetical protein
MIAKAIKGKGFRGALAYDLDKDDRRLLATNMDGANQRELAREFGEIRKLRPRLARAVLHVSLSAAPGERLTDAQWVGIGQHYLCGMGLNENQYLITRHVDTVHEHIHLLVNRIRFDGDVVSDSHDYRRQEVLMREIERDYALQPVQSSRDVARHAPTKGEIEEGLRTGLPSTRQRLQQLCDGAVAISRSYSEYAAHLAAAGVELVPVTQVDGMRLAGLSYRLDGVMMKGSDLGKGYSPAGLTKRGIGYEKDRDLETVGRQREQDEAGRPWHADRGAAPSEADERGRTGDNSRAHRAGYGGVDGRDTAESERDRGEGHGAGRTHSATDHGSGAGMPGGDGAGIVRGTATGARGQEDGVEPLPGGDGDRVRDGTARERILALAGTADCSELPGPESVGRRAAPRDRSLEAIQRQIGAMGAARYKVVLVDSRNKKEQSREWSAAELVRSVAWLKRMNARGHDVSIAPAGEHGLVLLDGLREDMLAAMSDKGFEPAATMQTGPGHYQAWIKLSDRPLSDDVRQHAVNGLKRAFCSQTASCERSDYGSLAGLTCAGRGEGQERARRFVLVHHASGAVAKEASALLNGIRKALEMKINQRKEILKDNSKLTHKQRGPSR